jgi:hypothetical protein
MIRPSTIRSAVRHLRTLALTWVAACFLPLPALLTTDPTGNAEVSCLYFGLACAWFAAEVIRTDVLPATRSHWRAKLLAIWVAVSCNAALFIALGLSVQVKSNIPFPLMAMLSTTPALGLIPWLTLRIRQPYAALLVGAIVVLAAKLAGCVVARIVYGHDFMARGYVDADWHNAKLMITIFWTLTVAISLGLFLADHRRFGSVEADSNATDDSITFTAS